MINPGTLPSTSLCVVQCSSLRVLDSQLQYAVQFHNDKLGMKCRRFLLPKGQCEPLDLVYVVKVTGLVLLTSRCWTDKVASFYIYTHNVYAIIMDSYESFFLL